MGLILFAILGQEISLFAAFFSFLWLVYLWETYLDYRQHRKILRTLSLPVELAKVIDDEKFLKAKAYALDKSRFSFIRDAYNMVQTSFILYFSVIPWLWYRVLQHAGVLNETLFSRFGINLGPQNEIWCSLIFLLHTTILLFFDGLPWSFYYNFVIEARHGFNKQTWKFFLWDRIKTLLLSIAIGFPVLSVLIWIIKAGGPQFYLYAYVFTLIVTLFMMFIYPEFIAPLFDRYTPLPEGTLREKIVALAERVEFPLKKLLVVEGSKRSAHSNAYFFGFGKNKRIVLYDTLIKGFKFPEKNKEDKDEPSDAQPSETTVEAETHGCSVDEEVVAVLAHELGHWKLGHTLLYLFISQVNLLLTFVVFSSLMNIEPIFTSFGFTHGVPILLKLVIVFQFIFSPYNTVFHFLLTVLSRRLEFQADHFAVSLGYGDYLKTSLLTLSKDNLSFPVCDWLYSMCNYSHPPLLERLEAIDTALSKED